MTEQKRLNKAVDAFAEAMKAKLLEKMNNGYRGWDNPNCREGILALAEANMNEIARGDHIRKRCVSAANYLMMIWLFEQRVIPTPRRPAIVCLCGSTRFWRTFQEQSLRETLAGNIVLSIGAARAADDDDKTFGGNIPAKEYDKVKEALDELHLRKIDLADTVIILNVDGYIGESTRREMEYAISQGKYVRMLEGGLEYNLKIEIE